MRLNKLYKKEGGIGKKSNRARKRLKAQLLSKRVITLEQLYEEIKFQKTLKKILKVEQSEKQSLKNSHH